jgi:hypothetical protein
LVHWLLNHGADPSKDFFDFQKLNEHINSLGNPWYSGLNCAANVANMDVFNLLVANGASVKRNIPLHCGAWSIKAGHEEWKRMIDYLVDVVGIDINADDYEQLVGYTRGTPLQYAFQGEHVVEAATYLFEKGANPYLQRGLSDTAMWTARQNPKYAELVELFETRQPPG